MYVMFPGQPLAHYTSAPLYSYCGPGTVAVSPVNVQCWTDVTLCLYSDTSANEWPC